MATTSRTTTAAPGKTLADAYVDFLAEEGYRPELEGPPDDAGLSSIRFKAEGTRYRLYLYEDDPEFVALACGFTLDGVDRAAAASLAAEIGDEVKVVKCSVTADGGTVHFTAELFLGGARMNAALLSRCLGTLRHASARFFERRVPPERLDA